MLHPNMDPRGYLNNLLTFYLKGKDAVKRMLSSVLSIQRPSDLGTPLKTCSINECCTVPTLLYIALLIRIRELAE